MRKEQEHRYLSELERKLTEFADQELDACIQRATRARPNADFLTESDRARIAEQTVSALREKLKQELTGDKQNLLDAAQTDAILHKLKTRILEKMEDCTIIDPNNMDYDVDIVMCIDATKSMLPFLNLVKSQALHLYEDIKAKMQEKNKQINELRVRVIAFRDYLADGDEAMMATPFFTLPRDSAAFERMVRSIQAIGGGDIPEDGLEALALAIKSPWNTQKGNKRRQLITVWTDAGTHPIGFGKSAGNYPSEIMPKDFAELTSWWGAGRCRGILDDMGKRLLIYAPDDEHWVTIAENWDNTIMYSCQAGKGLSNEDYTEILDAIAGTIIA